MAANFGAPGDELIEYDFYNPGSYSVIGVFTNTASGAPIENISGLDWCGIPGQSTLIAAAGFGGDSGPQPVYSVNPANAQSTFIGNSLGVADLAYRPADHTMYGTDAQGNLYRDTNNDCVPDSVVGEYNVGGLLEVGLAFDGAGDLLVHDLINNRIYKGFGANPASLTPLVSLPYNSNFSQGLYADATTGYHAAYSSSRTSESWDFDTNLGTSSYTFRGSFPIDPASFLPLVQVGDLAPVMEPLTTGEYFLQVKSTTPTLPAFQVASINPVDGSRKRGPVTELTIDFNDVALLTSLQASDVQIDGVPASSLTVIDGDTARFEISQMLSDGLHDVNISAGAVSDLQGTPIESFRSTFYNDIQAPRIVSSSIQHGDIVAGVPDLTVNLGFSEPMDVQNIDRFDIQLVSQAFDFYQPSSITFNDNGTELTLEFEDVREGEDYTLTLFSGDFGFQDTVGFDLDGETPIWPIPANVSGDGIEGGNFEVSFGIDIGTRAVPVPLKPVEPLGSLIYARTKIPPSPRMA